MFSTDQNKSITGRYNVSRIVLSGMLLTLSFGTSTYSETVHLLPGLPEKYYSQRGDITIGAMVEIMMTIYNPTEACLNKFDLSPYTIESTEAVAFAVDMINRSPYILPNVSLGFVVRGVCNSVGINIGTSLSFLPRAQRECNASMCSLHVVRSDSSWSNHDVIGVLSAGWSSLSVPVSSLYAVGKLPLLGPTETSDDLSNKKIHPYFFRIVPPDMYLVQAMLRFISSNGWSYISVIYEDGPYGQNAFDRIQKNADQYEICIATSHRLINPPKYDYIVSDLLVNHRARVVLLFTDIPSFRRILQSVVDRNATKHFIWVSGDAMAFYEGYEYNGVDSDPAAGTFLFDVFTLPMPSFSEHLQSLRISTTTNPWAKEVLEQLFHCSYKKGTCDVNLDITKSAEYFAQADTTARINSVLILAQAAHNLLADWCPDVQGDQARACINGELLKEYMKNTSFEAHDGQIEFDENQDVKKNYSISQLASQNVLRNNTKQKETSWKTVGFYDISTDTLTYFKENVSWAHLTSPHKVVNVIDSMLLTEAPQSKCSDACNVGEYKMQKELPCCWDCRKCRENEKVINDNTSCETCPSFMWPDPDSGFTSCKDIPLTYPVFNDPIPIVFTSLAIFALFITVCVIVSYFIYRNERVIKASSRELSAIQLFAIFTGYATVILFQTKPSDVICNAIFYLFCMSFAVLYSPLFVKTMRICRIFKSGSKNKIPQFISPRSQLFFAACLIAVQASLCIAVHLLYWPRAKRTQPIWSEKLVELSCDLTFPGIASFLGYNIILVSLCSVFAFMVRKLPDNFNESKFISMCVATTLLIWLAFIPTYFTADREFVRVFLLSVALFLNHSVALLFLFAPKIYAAKFLPSETGDFSKTRT